MTVGDSDNGKRTSSELIEHRSELLNRTLLQGIRWECCSSGSPWRRGESACTADEWYRLGLTTVGRWADGSSSRVRLFGVNVSVLTEPFCLVISYELSLMSDAANMCVFPAVQ
jgi:hypothetical protein